MARATRRRPGEAGVEDEREDEREAEAEPQPLDSGTIQSLREADPAARAQAILRLQRLHGNAAVQRVIHSLQVTDAGRDARVQQIGDARGRLAGSGKLEKAELYREAIEAELDASPVAVEVRARPGARQRQHDRADLRQLPGGAAHVRGRGRHGHGRGGPAGARQGDPARGRARRARARLRRRERDGGRARRPGRPRASGRRTRSARTSRRAPAERARLRAHEPRRGRAQADRRAADEAAQGPGLVRRPRRDAAPASGGGVVPRAARRLQPPAQQDGGGLAQCQGRHLQDADGALQEGARRPHRGDDRHRPASGGSCAPTSPPPTGASSRASCCRSTAAGSPSTALHLARHVVWEPAELATCEALFDARGTLRATMRNQKGAAHFDEFRERLRATASRTRTC